MKIKYIAVFAALLALPALNSCQSHGSEHEHEHEHAQQHDGDDDHQESHADGEIIFSPDNARRFGVETTIITPTDFYETIKVSGLISPAQGDEVTIVAPSSGTITLSPAAVAGTSVGAGASLGHVSAEHLAGGDQNESARITYEAASEELDRVTPLYQAKIVTKKEYLAAKENYEKARIAYNSQSKSGSTATVPITGTVTRVLVTDGNYVETGDPIATVAKNSKLLLRADLPERHAAQLPLIKSATFRTSYSPTVYDITALGGRRVSSSSTAGSVPGYVTVSFEITNDGTIIPGSYAEVYLHGAAKRNCIVIPAQAVTEELGEFFVYEKIDDEGYLKRRVTLGAGNGREVEVTSGLREGDQIVTAGAVMIKMAANAGAVPGHTHNH